ncbi:uncharacterized protein LOC135357194 [Latimeria chalumnae]|uniref:uncharacterized protein LOC135357194 n=1 Tax=Latimeria chalumnae TaxID=7897 RepID=UPI00313B9A54
MTKIGPRFQKKKLKPNQCSQRDSSEPTLLISEVNSKNPGTKENAEYIELIHTGRAAGTKLDGYWLVFYNGRNNRAYHALNLTGHQTGAGGYFLVGSIGMSPTPGITIPVKFIQNGPDGVATYKSKLTHYLQGMKLTGDNLEDAIVYTARADDSAPDLLKVLIVDKVLREDPVFGGFKQDESLSRCHSFKPMNSRSFELTTITPLQDNICATPPPPLHHDDLVFSEKVGNFLINEVNTMNGSEMGAFIELKVPPRANMSKYVMVLYDVTDQTAYAVIYLQGLSSADGYFVIGSPLGFTPDQLLLVPLREGPVAVTLYSGYFDNFFSVGGRVTDEVLLDALVYSSGNDVQEYLLYELTPGYPALQEYKGPFDGLLTLSRCSCCETQTSTVYDLALPTPGAMNDCPTSKFMISFLLFLQTRSNKFLCKPTMLLYVGNFLAKSLEQLQQIWEAYTYFISNKQFIYVSGVKLGIDKRRSSMSFEPEAPRAPSATDIATATVGPTEKRKLKQHSAMEAWKVSLTVVGAILGGLMATLGSLYYVKRAKVNAAIRNLRERIRPSTVAVL